MGNIEYLWRRFMSSESPKSRRFVTIVAGLIGVVIATLSGGETALGAVSQGCATWNNFGTIQVSASQSFDGTATSFSVQDSLYITGSPSGNVNDSQSFIHNGVTILGPFSGGAVSYGVSYPPNNAVAKFHITA